MRLMIRIFWAGAGGWERNNCSTVIGRPMPQSPTTVPIELQTDASRVRQEDEAPFNNISTTIQNTAQLMIMTPGKAIFLENTGHSLDLERNDFVAKRNRRIARAGIDARSPLGNGH